MSQLKLEDLDINMIKLEPAEKKQKMENGIQMPAHIVENFFSSSDRKRRIDPKNVKVSELQHWGVLNMLQSNSPSLKDLLSNPTVINEHKLPKVNYTGLFKTIMEELQFSYTIEVMETNESFKRECTSNKFTKIVIIETKTIPVFGFEGMGQSLESATERASKIGIEFLIAVSSDIVIMDLE